MIKVILANPRGICAGVRRAIDIVEQILKIYGAPVYVRHELVHNDYIISQFLKRGVVFVEKLEEVPDNSVLVFSAHGVSRAIRIQAKDKNLVIFDATCPLVMKVHMEVARAYRKGMEVILIGHANHPEVEGIMGQYVPNRGSLKKIYLVESESDARSLQVNYPNHLFFVTQTTMSVDDVLKIVVILRQRFPNILGSRKSDICYATFNRQDSLKRLTSMVEIIFVIGSNNSSNSNRLLELARSIGKISYLINNANDIQKKWLREVNSIGVTAGASVPDILVYQVLKKLAVLSTDGIFIEEMTGKKENIFFKIPTIVK